MFKEEYAGNSSSFKSVESSGVTPEAEENEYAGGSFGPGGREVGALNVWQKGPSERLICRLQVLTFGIVTVGCKPRIQLFKSNLRLSADRLNRVRENKNIQRYKLHI